MSIYSKPFAFILATVAIYPLCEASYAQDGEVREDDRATITIVAENDAFANTDKNYTNGVRLSYLSGTKDTSGVLSWFADKIGAEDDAVRRNGFSIGHTIFTPQDTEATEFLEDQQPYAGWLYGELNTVLQQTNSVDTIALQIGIIGPSAGGEFLQNNVHSLLGVDESLGWDNQLKDELGVNLSYDKKFQRIARIGLDNLSVDVTPNVGFTLGTLQTYANAGLTLRLGQDLDNDFGPPRVAPSLGGAGYFTPRDKFGWYLFAGVEGRAVAHNTFIEGSLFRDNNIVLERKSFVSDIQAGVVLQYKQQQLAFTLVSRSKEFDGQESSQQFGSVSLSRKF